VLLFRVALADDADDIDRLARDVTDLLVPVQPT
jgi:hypothetical protein